MEGLVGKLELLVVIITGLVVIVILWKWIRDKQSSNAEFLQWSFISSAIGR
ncbi:hypothetical protein [Psychrobacillus lasiicapitis]|uniref:hypothetical protein n=1 Tax=Psychrobacillus lasiicapitis TaxID=1636719 RepID=UPI001B881F0B|nr:hypothetical protein [Psychrobacillus lasiicapitis]